MAADDTTATQSPSGSQTLFRGLDLLDVVAESGAAQDMNDERMNALVEDVREAANAIGRDLGWNGKRVAR